MTVLGGKTRILPHLRPLEIHILWFLPKLAVSSATLGAAASNMRTNSAYIQEHACWLVAEFAWSGSPGEIRCKFFRVSAPYDYGTMVLLRQGLKSLKFKDVRSALILVLRGRDSTWPVGGSCDLQPHVRIKMTSHQLSNDTFSVLDVISWEITAREKRKCAKSCRIVF